MVAKWAHSERQLETKSLSFKKKCIEYRFFSHVTHADHTFPSPPLLPDALYLSSPSDPIPLYFPFKKNGPPRDDIQIGQNMTRDPNRERSRGTLLPLLSVPQNTNLTATAYELRTRCRPHACHLVSEPT